jgi:hypothetical protein
MKNQAKRRQDRFKATNSATSKSVSGERVTFPRYRVGLLFQQLARAVPELCDLCMTERGVNGAFKIFSLALAISFCITLEYRACAQLSGKSMIDAAIASKHNEIQVDLKSIENHPWAGSYRQTGTDEVELIELAPSGKIVAYQNFRGLHYENCGTAKAVGQELHVKWDYDDTQGRTCSLGDRLLVVPWGKNNFLIARGTIHSFCIRYRDTEYPLPERLDYVRSEGKVLLDGQPQLPDEFKLFWDLPEIKCQITAVEKAVRKEGDHAGVRKLTCTINKGSAAHIFVGMQMYASDKRSSWSFKVTSVEAQSATLETSLGRPFKEPRLGLSVTSNR